MQIQLFSGFRKRENSTKVPVTGSASRILTGYLREPCSIMNPVFTIERFASDASPQSFNYAFIPEFSRWYFVRDWSWENGVWQCQLEVDVLGSFKTDIGNSTAYIERCSSEYDGAIIDKMYPTTTNFNTMRVPIQTGWNGVTPTEGCYVVGIIGRVNRGASQLGGAVTYYAMTPAQMGALCGYLLSTVFLDDNGFNGIMQQFQQLTQETAKAIINPIQYITSCMWLPVSAGEIGDGLTHYVPLGYWEMDSNIVEAQYLTASAITLPITGQIPIHPQAATRGKYLNYAPYTRLTLYVPPFGSIPLDTSYCEIGSYLMGQVYIDTITGKATLRMELYPDEAHTGTGAIVCESSSMMGIPIQLAQMSPDFLSAIPAAIESGVNIARLASGDIGGYDAAFSSIMNATNALMPQVERSGVTGSFLAEVISPSLTAQHFIVVDEDNAEYGRPLMSNRIINTLSGFIKCGEAHVDFPCYIAEKQQILNYMLKGFYWE